MLNSIVLRGTYLPVTYHKRFWTQLTIVLTYIFTESPCRKFSKIDPFRGDQKILTHFLQLWSMRKYLEA